MTLKRILIFFDAWGTKWAWDGDSVYTPESEPFVPHDQNGYVVDNLEDGIEQLMEDGYMDEEV